MIPTLASLHKVPSRKSVPRTRELRSFLLAFVLITSGLATEARAQPAGAQAKHSYVPPNGFVPDSVTAARIAEAVLAAIYPAKVLDSERPFKATLAGSVWTVEGTMPQGGAGVDSIGGVAVVEMSKTDGRILRLSHGK